MNDQKISAFQVPSGHIQNEVLGSVFGVQPKVLDSLPKYQEDLFVVAGG